MSECSISCYHVLCPLCRCFLLDSGSRMLESREEVRRLLMWFYLLLAGVWQCWSPECCMEGREVLNAGQSWGVGGDETVCA